MKYVKYMSNNNLHKKTNISWNQPDCICFTVFNKWKEQYILIFLLTVNDNLQYNQEDV